MNVVRPRGIGTHGVLGQAEHGVEVVLETLQRFRAGPGQALGERSCTPPWARPLPSLLPPPQAYKGDAWSFMMLPVPCPFSTHKQVTCVEANGSQTG